MGVVPPNPHGAFVQTLEDDAAEVPCVSSWAHTVGKRNAGPDPSLRATKAAATTSSLREASFPIVSNKEATAWRISVSRQNNSSYSAMNVNGYW